ncbi:MAG: NAD-dependent epimerase/dehydratase family protein, partial [Planctomycetota bacterium]
MNLESKVNQLQGPILILGGSGFIGANLFKAILKSRDDVFGTATNFPAWRLKGLPEKNIITTDLLVDSNV